VNERRWIVAIFATGFLVRFWSLGSLPAAIHPDEMAGLVGVMDELSHRAPFRPFFDYRIFYLPLTGIGEYVSSLFFGYNATAYRFPSVIYGLVTIACTMGLTLQLTKDRLAAILSGAISAVLPWEITVSRIAWENATMLPCLLGGLWALAAGLEKRCIRLLIVSGMLLAIDAYSYRAALPDALALALALLLLHPKRSARSARELAIAGVVFLAIIAPLVYSVWNDPSFFWRDRHIATFAGGINAGTLATFAQNYLAHFAIGPLFFYGDGNPQHGPIFGVLYLWMLPFIAAGLVIGFQRYGIPLGLFLLFWLALYPLGGALTDDGVPHFLRTLVGAPLAVILTAMGLAFGWRILREAPFARIATFAFLALAALDFAAFCQAYFIVYPPAAARAFQYSNRDLFVTIRAHLQGTRRICFSGLNDMNSLTLFSYYLRDVDVPVIEHADVRCWEPGSLVAVVGQRHYVPANARLVATVQDYDGAKIAAIFLTK
jgi:hypothetical protein